MENFYNKQNHSEPLAFLKLFLVVLFLFLFAEPNNAQVVSPVQSGHYMPGVTNIRDMAHPPPGLFVIWYNVFISSNQFYDRDGNAIKYTYFLSQIDPSLPNVRFRHEPKRIFHRSCTVLGIQFYFTRWCQLYG